MSSSEAPIRVGIVDFHTGRDLPGRTVVQTTTCGRLDGMTAFFFFFPGKSIGCLKITPHQLDS